MVTVLSNESALPLLNRISLILEADAEERDDGNTVTQHQELLQNLTLHLE